MPVARACGHAGVTVCPAAREAGVDGIAVVDDVVRRRVVLERLKIGKGGRRDQKHQGSEQEDTENAFRHHRSYAKMYGIPRRIDEALKDVKE